MARCKVDGSEILVMRGYLRRCALGLPSVDTETGKLYFADDVTSPKLDRLIADLPTYEGKHTLIFTHSKQRNIPWLRSPVTRLTSTCG